MHLIPIQVFFPQKYARNKTAIIFSTQCLQIAAFQQKKFQCWWNNLFKKVLVLHSTLPINLKSVLSSWHKEMVTGALKILSCFGLKYAQVYNILFLGRNYLNKNLNAVMVFGLLAKVHFFF